MSVPDGMTTQLSYLEVTTFCLLLNSVVIITSGQSNLTKGRIAAAHGWFSGIGLIIHVVVAVAVAYTGNGSIELIQVVICKSII